MLFPSLIIGFINKEIALDPKEANCKRASGSMLISQKKKKPANFRIFTDECVSRKSRLHYNLR